MPKEVIARIVRVLIENCQGVMLPSHPENLLRVAEIHEYPAKLIIRVCWDTGINCVSDPFCQGGTGTQL